MKKYISFETVNGNNHQNSNNNNSNNNNNNTAFIFRFKNEISLRRFGFTLHYCDSTIVNEMNGICDKLIEWSKKKFDKPIIHLYQIASDLFDPKR